MTSCKGHLVPYLLYVMSKRIFPAVFIVFGSSSLLDVAQSLDKNCDDTQTPSLLQRGHAVQRQNPGDGAMLGDLARGELIYAGANSSANESAQPTDPEVDDPRLGLGCMRNTGGTCNVFGCLADRGPTVCEHVPWILGKSCLCQEGLCASLDGRCRASPTALPVGNATRYTLRNVQWPDHFVRFSRWGNALTVTQDSNTSAGHIRLFSMPTAQGQKPSQFLMRSSEFPDYVATSTSELVCQESGGEHGSRHCHTEFLVRQEWMYKPDHRWVLKIRRANWAYAGNEVAVTIESLSMLGRFWYVPRMSWEVGLTDLSGDPGPQGYWVFDPPLPADLLPPAA